MMSKPVTGLLSTLDVHKSVSRPHVSNDNPYSEAHFKTMKYRPEFPRRFGSIQDVRARLGPFFDWYNGEHRHRVIGYFTPNDVHNGHIRSLQARRQEVLTAAYQTHPQRFVKGLPKPPAVSVAAWIHPPTVADEENMLDRAMAYAAQQKEAPTTQRAITL